MWIWILLGAIGLGGFVGAVLWLRQQGHDPTDDIDQFSGPSGGPPEI